MDWILKAPSNRLRVLRLYSETHESSGAYNLFSLPWRGNHDITVCTFFKAEITPPKEITLLEGDGSLRTWLNNMKIAFKQEKFDIIHVHSPQIGIAFLFASLLFRKFASSRIISVHNSYQIFSVKNKLAFIPSFAFSHRIVFCSYASHRSFPRLIRWLGRKKIRIVLNGVDLSRIDNVVDNVKKHRVSDSNSGTLKVVTIGRLVAVKNVVSTLCAFKQIRDESTTLTIIGEGPLDGKLRAMVDDLHLADRVEMTGLIRRNEVYTRLAGADLFVSASKGEGLPVAVLEAMACRCPVILSDIPPHREIAEGVDFIPLLDPDDVPGFAREINRFRLMSPSERTGIGEKCRDLVVTQFSLSEMYDGYQEVYIGALKTQRIR